MERVQARTKLSPSIPLESWESHATYLIGFGGGPPSAYELPQKTGYVFYGSAGLTDFNYEEMRALDGELDDHEITHRFDFFEGGHQWGPSEVCTRAVEWLEIQAMKSGLREKDDGIVAKVRELEKRDEVRDTRKLEERLAKRHPKADTAKAIESLQKAHEIRPLDPDLLTEDTYLDPIREEPEFKELLQRLNDPRSSASFPLIRD